MKINYESILDGFNRDIQAMESIVEVLEPTKDKFMSEREHLEQSISYLRMCIRSLESAIYINNLK